MGRGQKKARRGGGEKQRNSFSVSPLPPLAFFALAPLFARSLISRSSILDDLPEEKRRLLAVYVALLKNFKNSVQRHNRTSCVIITDLELEILEETAERVLTIKIIHISNKEIVLLF